MDNSNISECLNKVRFIFPGAFITLRNELILERKNNIYFNLNDIEDETEFKCKMIAWLSRPSCRGLTNYWQRKILKMLNEYLETDFNNEEMMIIYGRLGNDVNRKLTINFIESGYNLNILE